MITDSTLEKEEQTKLKLSRKKGNYKHQSGNQWYRKQQRKSNREKSTKPKAASSKRSIKSVSFYPS